MKKDYFKEATNEPQHMSGVLMPLFDRLTTPLSPGEEAGENSKKFYTKSETIASIEREISRLLNTRTGLKSKALETLAKEKNSHGLPGFYGIPDFSSHDGSSQAQWPDLQKICRQAIERNEPRLKNVKVKIHEYDKTQHFLILSISGRLTLKSIQEEVTFPIRLQS